MNNNDDNNNNKNNNNKNNNDIFLGSSLAQGQVFRKQQQTRISTNNNVVTSNTAREQNKNKVNKQKNGKTTMAMIEPFSQKNALNNNNNNDNYNIVTKKDITIDEERIQKTNDRENSETTGIISDYSQMSDKLNKFQQGVTNQANVYNNTNKTPTLLNQNYSTADSKTIRVNNTGVVNTLDPTSIPSIPPLTPGINITTSIAAKPPGLNYAPVEDIPPGSTSGTDAGLYGDTSSISVRMPQGISGYNLEGENVRVIHPFPNSRTDINKNMSYIGAFTREGVPGLSLDSAMPIETTLNCLQRAVDKGSSWCGMTQYGDIKSSVKGGHCMIGSVSNLSSYAYKSITKSQTGSNTILKHPQGYTTITFGADGVLYAGHDNYKFAYPLTKTFNSDLDSTYGGTINSFIGAYGLNQGRWQNLANFSGNSDPTGQPFAKFETKYEYDVQVPNTRYYTHYYYDSMGQQQSEQRSYIYYTTEKRTSLAAPDKSGGNITYINYSCGKVPTKKPIYIGGQVGGAGYNISCNELYSNYPSFTLELSDNGILTITNNTSSAEVNADSKKVTYDMSFEYQKVTLSNKQVVTLNMPRPDWVSGGINKTGQALTASSRNIHSIANGGWISSPQGFCRLILNGGTMQLEYSLQDVSQDTDGNPVGNGSSVALYSIQNVNASNLGSSAHIDINGALNPYPSQPTSMITYSNTYSELKGYIPNPAVLNKPNSNVIANANDSQCRIACSNDPTSTCAGYIVYNGKCNLLTADNVFPIGDRIPDPQYSTYIRNPMFPQNDKSCRKTLDANIGTDAYSYYLGNGITSKPPSSMTPATKCNLGKVLDSQMKELEIKNQQAVKKGEVVKGQFQELFYRKNKVLNSISDNRTTAKMYNDDTKKATDNIQAIQNSQITKSAAEKDSELLLVSDNYRYVIWGIVSLLLSIATIKGLRVASS